MEASDTNSAPTKSEYKAAENKAPTYPDAISPVSNQTVTAAVMSPVTVSLSLEECIRVALHRQVAEHLLWSYEQKEQVSKRLIELFDQETEKSQKASLLIPHDPDAEKKVKAAALLAETNAQMLLTIECRKKIPPKCVEHLARMARLECSYYKQVCSGGHGLKERMEAAKIKYQADNSELIESDKERRKLLTKQIEMNTNDLTKLSQTLTVQQSNIRTVIDVNATRRNSLMSRTMSKKSSDENVVCLPDGSEQACLTVNENMHKHICH